MIRGVVLVEHLPGHSFIESLSPSLTLYDYEASIILKSTASPPPNSVFAFTIDCGICYCYTFGHGKGNFAIAVLAADFKYPRIMIDFLKDCRCYFNGHQNLDPNCRFNVVSALLGGWEFLGDSIYVMTTKGYTKVFLEKIDGFEPSNCFSYSTDYNEVWKSLLLDRGVLVVAESVEDVAEATLSIAGLANPFEYKGGVLIVVDDNDERLYDPHVKYGVIGVVSRLPQIEKYGRNFGYCLLVEKGKGQSSDCDKIRKKGRLLMELMETISDRNLENCPYHEITGQAVVTEDIDDVLCPEMKMKTMTFNELREFERTETFVEWMEPRVYRQQLRNSFLSVQPREAVSRLGDEDVEVAYMGVKHMLAANPNDSHLRSVLRKHRRELEGRLDQLESHSSDSSDSML